MALIEIDGLPILFSWWIFPWLALANCECHSPHFFAQAEVNEVILHGATGWEVPVEWQICSSKSGCV